MAISLTMFAQDLDRREAETSKVFDFQKADAAKPHGSPAVMSDISTALGDGGDDDQSVRSNLSDSEGDELQTEFPTLASFFEKKQLEKKVFDENPIPDVEAWSNVASRLAMALEDCDSESEDEAHGHIHAWHYTGSRLALALQGLDVDSDTEF
eukprot:gnl/MRDRNA2_/MRDRNA2_137536_c0_seq1.p1 gnl/MRDRNA2_/MRDRNA2_137536_c0~~gnl/MRDRNA2_/MRDRNA2_137536_c0_seq1.p1  ORF type:complete len:153 (-),score=45.91 gnl/MRDRNA2_/MRDRNA2_137536_c0_seq1:148-606(-)